ncbi:N-acetylmuramidase family protein [Mesorhizobium sp. M0902]
MQAMAEAMMADEALQLGAAIDFIVANRLDGNLRNHDWAAFAKGYNGAGYRKNAYDTRLAEAYRKWSRIKDTPWPSAGPVSSAVVPAVPPEPAKPIAVPQATAAPASSAPPVPAARPGLWAALIAAILKLSAILKLFGRK